MTIADTHKYMITLFTNKLCVELIDAIFRYQDVHFNSYNDLERKFLALISNIIECAANIESCSEATYNLYVQKCVVALGYEQSDVLRTDIFKLSMKLRKVFEADESVLKDEYGLKRFGHLPNANEIHNIVGFQINYLAMLFRQAFENYSNFLLVEKGTVKNFMKQEINKRLDADEYLA